MSSVLIFNTLCHFIFVSYVTCLTLNFNTVYVPFHPHGFLVHLKSRTVIIVVAFNSVLSQTRCSLEPRKCLRGQSTLNLLLRGSEYPGVPPALLMLATLAFLLIMFTCGIIFVFYLILFPAGFSDIHLGHNKTA